MDKQLSGREFKQILRMYGDSQKAFAQFIEKSPAFVSQTLGRASAIPLRYYDALTFFVGEENMQIALQRIERERAEKERRMKEKTNPPPPNKSGNNGHNNCAT